MQICHFFSYKSLLVEMEEVYSSEPSSSFFSACFFRVVSDLKGFKYLQRPYGGIILKLFVTLRSFSREWIKHVLRLKNQREFLFLRIARESTVIFKVAV